MPQKLSEFLYELENDFELGKEDALELEPIPLQEIPTKPSSGDGQANQPISCPKDLWKELSGFASHRSNVSSLPSAEQEKIRSCATLILMSRRPGCRPIVNVGIVGHADKDVRLGAAGEQRISEERARAVQRDLEGHIRNANPRVLSELKFRAIGVGSRAMAVPNPKTEPERARNRRVEIYLGPIPLDGLINGVTVGSGGASIRVAILAPGSGELSLDLYRDPVVPLLARTEWMRRGAMLGIAQRAFTNGHRVKLITANGMAQNNNIVESIEIYKP